MLDVTAQISDKVRRKCDIEFAPPFHLVSRKAQTCTDPIEDEAFTKPNLLHVGATDGAKGEENDHQAVPEEDRPVKVSRFGFSASAIICRPIRTSSWGGSRRLSMSRTFLVVRASRLSARFSVDLSVDGSIARIA
jgi:hypothetical protein